MHLGMVVMSRPGDLLMEDCSPDPTLFNSAQLASNGRALLAAELCFYQNYSWCLNPFWTVEETLGHLKNEIASLETTNHDWRFGEVMTNIYLLSCTLLNSIDDYLRGPTFRLPRPILAMSGANFA